MWNGSAGGIYSENENEMNEEVDHQVYHWVHFLCGNRWSCFREMQHFRLRSVCLGGGWGGQFEMSSFSFLRHRCLESLHTPFPKTTVSGLRGPEKLSS